MINLQLPDPQVSIRVRLTRPPLDLPAIIARAQELPAGQTRKDLLRLITEVRRLQQTPGK